MELREQGSTFGRGRPSFPPVGLFGRAGWSQKLPTPGRGANEARPHLSSHGRGGGEGWVCAPRGQAAEARRWGPRASARTEASSGHRGKQERAGREGTSCQGLGLPSFAKEVLPGPEGRRKEVCQRLVRGCGRRVARGRGRSGCGGERDRARDPTHPPQSPRRLSLPACPAARRSAARDASAARTRPGSAAFHVLPFGAELGFPLTRPAPHLPALGPHEPLPSAPERRPHPSHLRIPSRGLS